MNKQAECDDAIAKIQVEQTRQTNAGHTLGATQLQARIDTLTTEKNR